MYIIKNIYTTILIRLDFKVAHKKSCLVNHLHLEKGALMHRESPQKREDAPNVAGPKPSYWLPHPKENS